MVENINMGNKKSNKLYYILSVKNKNKNPIIEYLIEYGTNINIVNKKNDTPLIIHVGIRVKKITKYLIELSFVTKDNSLFT